MTDNYIQLKKNENLKLGIKTEDGKDTGEYLEFNLEDIELPLRYQEMVEADKKNKNWLKNQLVIIEKREDVKGKKLFSKNEEDTIKAINDFLKKEVKIYNMFLGKNGVQKLLNGQKLSWTSLMTIDEIIEKQILPFIDFDMERIKDKIRNKYNQFEKKDNNVLK